MNSLCTLIKRVVAFNKPGFDNFCRNFLNIILVGMVSFLVEGFFCESACNARTRSISRSIFISNGEKVRIKPFKKIYITPPVGWEVKRGDKGMSLVMQERVARKRYERLKSVFFQRNISVAVFRNPRPIDNIQAETFKSLLKEKYKKWGVSQFSVSSEHLFFNNRGINDGILVFANAQIGGVLVTQMHALVSGANKSAVITYSDLHSNFDSEDQILGNVWHTIRSISFEGTAPKRNEKIYINTAISVVIVLVVIIAMVLRSRRAKKYYDFIESQYDQASDEELGNVDHDRSDSKSYLSSKIYTATIDLDLQSEISSLKPMDSENEALISSSYTA